MTYLSRRNMLAVTGAAVGTAALPAASTLANQDENDGPAITIGDLKQSVCKWCMPGSLEEVAAVAKKIGLKSVELLNPDQIPIVKKMGLTCAIVNAHGINNGLNRTQNHEQCLAKIRKGIAAAREHGCRNVITFSGNRGGMDEDEGLKNCEAALKQIVGEAEKAGVVIIMEYLNSKDHKDYMFDHMSFGVELCKRIGSDNFKILYDIYHVQRMEGEIINMINEFHQYIGHYHTAGNPGRKDLDDQQELQYRPIMQAIKKTGYEGFIGQEFYPKHGLEKSLAQAARVCDV